MQYTETVAVLKVSSEVIKCPTIGAASFGQSPYVARLLPVRGVVGHNIDRCIMHCFHKIRCLRCMTFILQAFLGILYCSSPLSLSSPPHTHTHTQSLATCTRLWYLIDARGQVVGRLASMVSLLLQGKTKPVYHPAGDISSPSSPLSFTRYQYSLFSPRPPPPPPPHTHTHTHTRSGHG